MTDLWALATTDAYFPFTIAFFLMLGIGLIEAIGLGIGELPDVHLDLDGDADGFSLLSWLGFGSGIPILIWLTLLLAFFTLTGFIGQQLITEFFHAPLSEGWAIGGALILSLVFNMFASKGLSRVLPKEETSALDPEDLLLYRGTVVTSPAVRNKPSRVKVVDRFGQAHYLPIEPQDDNVVLPVGDVVLLVRKEGPMFFGKPDTIPLFRSI